jgi:serine/threonine-protein kinase
MLTKKLRLEREIGHGAMGAVWVATNLALGSQAAVKVMKACESAEQVRRFQSEARWLAQLHNPHVVRIFDLGVCEDGEPFIVMELLEGEDLRSRIERLGPMPLDEVALVMRQLCSALASAHERGIVHRDIKPANIFLTAGAHDFLVKVLDFGVAKFLGPDLGMTRTGALMGTPYYASPEQLIDPKGIDHRADLWSAAVVAYACVTAKLPFVAETLGALSIAIHEGDFEPPSVHRRELPPALDLWMTRALAREPDDRFATALELASTFDEAARAPRTTATVTTPLEAVDPIAITAAPSPSPTNLSQSTLSPISTAAAVNVREATLGAAQQRRFGRRGLLAVAGLLLAGITAAIVYLQPPTHPVAAPSVAARTASAPTHAVEIPARASAPPRDGAHPTRSAAPTATTAAPLPAPASIAPRPRPVPRTPPPTDDNPFKGRRK